MTTLISSYKDIKFTILPCQLNTEDQEGLLNYSCPEVLGYVTYDKKTDTFTAICLKADVYTQCKNHWSLDILNDSYKYDQSWILFSCPPVNVPRVFRGILNGDLIRIDAWDTWSIEGKMAKAALITNYENLR